MSGDSQTERFNLVERPSVVCYKALIAAYSTFIQGINKYVNATVLKLLGDTILGRTDKTYADTARIPPKQNLK